MGLLDRSEVLSTGLHPADALYTSVCKESTPTTGTRSSGWTHCCRTCLRYHPPSDIPRHNVTHPTSHHATSHRPTSHHPTSHRHTSHVTPSHIPHHTITRHTSHVTPVMPRRRGTTAWEGAFHRVSVVCYIGLFSFEVIKSKIELLTSLNTMPLITVVRLSLSISWDSCTVLHTPEPLRPQEQAGGISAC